MASIVMAYIVMASIVMAYIAMAWQKVSSMRDLNCYGLYGHGLYSYGLHCYGLYSYGLYSYGLAKGQLHERPQRGRGRLPCQAWPRRRPQIRDGHGAKTCNRDGHGGHNYSRPTEMDTVAITIVGQLRWTRCHNYDCWPLACQYRLGRVRCTASHYCHTCMLRCLQLCDGRTVWDVVAS